MESKDRRLSEIPPLILVVDDEESVRDFLNITLSQKGWRVVCQSDAENALKYLDREIPDLIILDIMMPKMDGYALCRAIRSNPALTYIPVIFLTAYAELDSLKKAKNVGAQGFIEKPVPPEELVQQVDGVLKGNFLMPTRLKKFS